MKRALLDIITPWVRRNCLISDATFWGSYTTCGLLMRMRELYRFEHEIAPGEPLDRESVLSWIGQRETEWQELDGAALATLSYEGADISPFDSDAINSLLMPHGLVYGAGYGAYMKPVFFLGDLHMAEQAEGCAVRTVGREYAHDISMHPAMSMDGAITLRRDVMLDIIHGKFEEFIASKGSSRAASGTLAYAFKEYGVEAGSESQGAAALRSVADAELRSLMRHEIGEVLESRRLGPQWASMFGALGCGRLSGMIRGLKDALADACDGGLIDHAVKSRLGGAVGFYINSLHGVRYHLSRPMREAFPRLRDSADWQAIEQARKAQYEAAARLAGMSLAIHAEHHGSDVYESEMGALFESARLQP